MPEQVVKVGAVGWLHKQWDQNYYPEDIPREWKLDYYANELSCVLLLPEFWLNAAVDDIEEWTESLDTDFCFCIKWPDTVVDKQLLYSQLTRFTSSAQVWLLAEDDVGMDLPENTSCLLNFEHPLGNYWRNDDKALFQFDITGLDKRAQRQYADALVADSNEKPTLCVILDADGQQDIVDFRIMLELMGIA